LNYRHAFHAGNFADLVKHAALIETLDRLTRGSAPPLMVIDTHAGAGRYDLGAAEARRSGEAEEGAARLAQARGLPAPLLALREAVRAAERAWGGRAYPGSPWITAQRLRPGDRLLACELRPEEHAALAKVMKPFAHVETRCADGFATLETLPAPSGAAFALIDPPFERADDYRRAVRAAGAALARAPRAVVMIWLPLKDLETFDGFLRDLESEAPETSLLVAEARMRPLTDPMRMNGCALVFANPPAGLETPLEAVCAWVAQALGEHGAARIWRPG
jgi:23S rRNA (adenine2030-N6)-methyltransferase